MALAHTLRSAEATLVLLSVLCVACAAECPNAFSGLTTCAVLNGQTSVGSALELKTLAPGLEARVQNAYASLSLPFVKGVECKAVFEPFLCWQSATPIIAGICPDGADAPHSVTPFLACSQWCADAMRVCMPSATPADIDEQCSKFTFAQPGLECMDSQGMHSAVAA
jgi:hypothetical protein